MSIDYVGNQHYKNENSFFLKYNELKNHANLVFD